MTRVSPAARAAWLALGITLPVYLWTMNRTIGFIDRGELAAVAATFGIAHPTGYPTLMLLAGAVVHLVPLRPVLVLGALACVLTAAGVAVLTLLLERVLRAVALPGMAPGRRAAYALLAGLFVAFTATWWQQSNGFEVYALHALLMPLVVLLFERWCDAAAADGDGAASPATRRAGFAFAAVVGLSFTNHLTTVLLAPGLLIAAAIRFGVGAKLWRRVVPLAPPFVLGLLPYLWLPLRSRMHPRLDWGGVRTARAFLHHVSGADYQRWMFADWATVSLQLRYLAWHLPFDLLFAGVVIAGLGASLLARRAPRHAALAIGIMVAGVVFASGYGIPDLDAYLLTVVLGLALCTVAGLALLHERFGARVALPLAAALVLGNGLTHARECDERDNRMVENFVHDVMRPLPRGAVLLTDLWENLEAGSLYFQEVEGYRRDVAVVSPELARHGWYLDDLERREPEMVARAGGAYRDYRAAVRVLESGGPGTLERLESARGAFIEAFVAGGMRDRAVFTTGVVPGLDPEWRQIPWQLVTWIRADSAYVAEPADTLAFEPWRERLDVYAALTYEAYARARLARARYEAAHGRSAEAERRWREAIGFDPHIRPERVGPQPLGLERIVLETARFFRDLPAADPRRAG